MISCIQRAEFFFAGYGLLVFALCILLGCGDSDSELSIFNASIHGTLTNATNNQPLQGVSITVENADNKIVALGFTDQSGRYQLGRIFIAEETYDLTFTLLQENQKITRKLSTGANDVSLSLGKRLCNLTVPEVVNIKEPSTRFQVNITNPSEESCDYHLELPTDQTIASFAFAEEQIGSLASDSSYRVTFDVNYQNFLSNTTETTTIQVTEIINRLTTTVTIVRDMKCTGCNSINAYGGPCPGGITCNGCCQDQTCITTSNFRSDTCPIGPLGNQCQSCGSNLLSCQQSGTDRYICLPNPNFSCTDNKQNGDETGIDCGGSCPNTCLPESCSNQALDPGERQIDCGGICPSCMRAVQPGVFSMGCINGDTNCQSDEVPRHQILLDSFMIDENEVTVEAYLDCYLSGTCSIPDNVTQNAGCNWGSERSGSHPINCVSWDQANIYCRYAKKRLPTEAEWERAARDNTTDIYSWGNDAPNSTYGVFAPSSHTSVVRSKSVLANQLFDMAGNVSEWVQDCYDTNIYIRRAGTIEVNPANNNSCTNGTTRGSSHITGLNDLRVSDRNNLIRSTKSPDLGFRCAHTGHVRR